MQENVIRRFDFNVICGGVLYIVQRAGAFGKVVKFLHEESFFEGLEDERVKALREFIRVAKSVYYNDPDSFTYHNVLNQIRIQNVDMTRGDAYVNYADTWYKDSVISSLSNQSPTFDTLVLYLQAISFGRRAKKLVQNYQSGNMIETKSEMEGMLIDMNLIKDSVNEVNTISLTKASILQKIQENSKKIESGAIRMEKLYLGERSEVDDKIGGFDKKTLNLIIGLTGNGKTVMLHHVIRRCIAQKMMVHLFCVEDREDSFMYKFIASNTGIPFDRLKNHAHRLSAEEDTLIHKCLDDFEKYVIVDFYFGHSVDDIHQRTMEKDTERRALGLPIPSVHIVDYTGHIAAFSKGEKGYEKMRMAYGARKDFALKSNKICFDGAQINREGGKKMMEGIITHHDLAGAFDIAQVCDNIISISRGEMDKKSQEAILTICKARDGETGAQVRVKTEFGCNRFHLEKVDPKPLESNISPYMNGISR